MLVAPRVRVGAGGFMTAAVAFRDADTAADGPPRFEQTSVNVSVPTTAGVIVWLPVAASVPLQLPEAVQLGAGAELQLMVVDLPTVTELDASVSVGAAGGVPEVAKRVAELAADVPPAPVHVNVYTVAPATAGVTVRLPLAAGVGGVKFVAGFATAVHEVEVASRVDQESVVELPNGIDVAASVSVGTTKAAFAWM